MSLAVNRLPHRITPDVERVIIRLFRPGDEGRAGSIIKRILNIPETEVAPLLKTVKKQFGSRHRDLDEVLLSHFEAVREFVSGERIPDGDYRLLIGAYFTQEYSIEAAALFNPSMVVAMDQRGVAEGSTRFLMSLRATGEGHLSSVVFRSGIIDRDCNIEIAPRSPYSRPLELIEDHSFSKERAEETFSAIGALTDPVKRIFAQLPPRFTLEELQDTLDRYRAANAGDPLADETCENLLALARAHYRLKIPEGVDVSEMAIFPTSDNESRGIEDVRLVRFVDDDQTVQYYGTYTAYNGFRIFPQMFQISTDGVVHVSTMGGRCAQNKGMALFPRKLGGDFTMVSRMDAENMYLMRSKNIRVWNEAELLQTPRFPWEIIQVGNCGSPIETEEGWLLLTHGVGPMRQYCIGATLLDLEDPSKLVGQTKEPILVPTEEDRSGYVPNVVYSCGGMIHNGSLIIPYAMNDMYTSFATLSVEELLTELKKG